MDKLREAVERFLGRTLSTTTLGEFVKEAEAALAEPVADEPVAFCHLLPNGKIGYFEGYPMVMTGPVGNEHHETPLYTRPAPAPSERGEYPPLPEPFMELHRDRASLDEAANEYAISYFVDQVDKKYARDKARGMQMDSISYYLRDLLYWVRNHVDADRAQRAPLTDEQAAKLCAVGPVYAPDGLVNRMPAAYRRELQDATLRGFRLAERAHKIGAKP